MSLQPTDVCPVPEETARVARAAFPRGNLYMRMRDELGVFYRDERFAHLFPTRGQPAETPWRLALILVMQYAEGLSDEQTARAVAGRIDWKYALSLELTEPSFDASVLSEFRTRIAAAGAEAELLDAMLERFKSLGLVKARGRQRTDSTHVLMAARWLNRLECVTETVRHTLNVLATVAPEWLRPHLQGAWVERYGRRADDYHLPKDKAAREALAAQIGADGFTLLRAIDAVDAPAWLREVPVVDVLRQIWAQQYEEAESPGSSGEPQKAGKTAERTVRWRAWEDLPAAAEMINSPYELEARYSTKRDDKWTGYKVHFTETCDADLPHVITNVETTPATTPDFSQVPVIHEALVDKQLPPDEHLLDAGYVDSDNMVESQRDHHITLVGPAPVNNSWQERAGEGFSLEHFVVDWDRRHVTCPRGVCSTKWTQTLDSTRNTVINIRFPCRVCVACSDHARCTTSPRGREITIRPRAQYEYLQAARQRQKTPEFKALYDLRAGVEGTLSEGLRVCDLRKARYIGLAKTHLQHVLTGAAISLHRVFDWLEGNPRASTRTAPFVALVSAAL